MRKIILDCDPGHDDAIAMILAEGSPAIDLVAITTCAGNQTLEKVTRNARAIASVAGIRAPIAGGCIKPLIRKQVIAEYIHGESGLEGPVMPEITVPLSEKHGVDLIIETIMTHPAGEITLVPTGPLTNIAMAARREPKIVERVKEVVLMGGGYHIGNWSAVAEFNIVADPEAAHIVFSESWPVVMVGLDLTHQALATDEILARIGALNTPIAKLVVELLQFFGSTYKQEEGFSAPPVHDPCAVAYLIDPAIVKTRTVPVSIELTGTHTYGMTVADFRSKPHGTCNTKVATELDFEKFWHVVIAAIETLGNKN